LSDEKIHTPKRGTYYCDVPKYANTESTGMRVPLMQGFPAHRSWLTLILGKSGKISSMAIESLLNKVKVFQGDLKAFITPLEDDSRPNHTPNPKPPLQKNNPPE